MASNANSTYWNRKAAHQCTNCGEQLAEWDTRTKCQLCRRLLLEKQKAYNSRKRDERQAQTGFRTRKQHIDYGSRRYHALKDAGLCTACGKNPARPNKTMCEVCASCATDRNTMYRLRMIAANKCIRCRKQLADGYKWQACYECSGLINDKAREARERKKQHG